MTIGYFGDEFSHTYACALKYFSENKLKGFASVLKAMEAVERGEIDGAVLPIENSVGGAVADTLDSLKKCDVYVTAQYLCPISQSLIAVTGASKDGIKKIYSHYQALAQCEDYIKKNFPSAKLYTVSNTSEALKIIKNVDEAAIARAPVDGQVILEEDVEDNKRNATKFVFVQKSPAFNGTTASVIFDVQHRPGALLKMLSKLAERNLNMTKLESRPSRDEFKYWFYLEFECPKGKEQLLEVMKAFSEHADGIRFVGMY